MTRPPSLDPARGVRALEIALARLGSAQRELGLGYPAERVSLSLSNTSAMFQQALTIGRYNLPGNDQLNGGLRSAMEGTVLLGAQLRRGTAPPAVEIDALFGAWRAVAIDGIAALQEIAPAESLGVR